MAQADCLAIIAMKGHPCTGKSTLALTLAENLKWPLIDLDDVLNGLGILQQSTPTSLISAADAENLNDASYKVVCQMALTQLSLNLGVIVDSPLSHRAHLDQLLRLSASTGAPLVIIECKPQDKYEWKQRLERQRAVDGTTSWYKPSTWDDLQSLLEQYDGCSDYEVGDISKLMVDTTAYVREQYLVEAVNQLRASKRSHCVGFFEWMAEGFKPLEGEEEEDDEAEEHRGEYLRDILLRNTPPSYHVHRFTTSSKQNNECKLSCRKCLRLISGPTYNCTECDLSLHQSCAELSHLKEILPNHYPPFINLTSRTYSFPETHRCQFHIDANMEFSYYCGDCLFDTHLRCAILPTVIHQKFHEHPLIFVIFPFQGFDNEFQCHACCDIGKNAYYCCFECNLDFHIDCALLPYTSKHEIHRHPLSLTFLHHDDSSYEYYCDVCEEKRHPKHLIYYCAGCDFPCHTSCMTFLE